VLDVAAAVAVAVSVAMRLVLVLLAEAVVLLQCSARRSCSGSA